jgi:hypothetical protein
MQPDETRGDAGAPVPASRPELPPRPWRSSRFLFESVVIVASVALGFLVTEWRQRAADHELSRRILTNVIAEMTGNRARLEGQIALHQGMLDRLERLGPPAAGASAWDVVTGSLQGSLNALPLRRAAWDAAVSSGALRLIDYDVAARLSDIYMVQDEGYGRTMQRVGESLFVPESFVPDRARELTQMFRRLLQELVGLETYMLEVYDEHLPALRAASDG